MKNKEIEVQNNNKNEIVQKVIRELKVFFLQFIPIFLLLIFKIFTTIEVSKKDIYESILLMIIVDASSVLSFEISKDNMSLVFVIILVFACTMYCISEANIIANMFCFEALTIFILLWYVIKKVIKTW